MKTRWLVLSIVVALLAGSSIGRAEMPDYDPVQHCNEVP